MNPTATPFYPAGKTTYATVLGEQFTYTQALAIYTPFAPIEMLTDDQKAEQQQVDDLSKKISTKELLALRTAMAAAEFVLE